MKNQTYGHCPPLGHFSHLEGLGWLLGTSTFVTVPLIPLIGPFSALAPVTIVHYITWPHVVEDYRENRQNGNEEDAPDWDFPQDGEYGYRSDDEPNNHWRRYTEGPKDRQWMEARDRNYIARLERSGCADETERQDLAEWRELHAADYEKGPQDNSGAADAEAARGDYVRARYDNDPAYRSAIDKNNPETEAGKAFAEQQRKAQEAKAAREHAEKEAQYQLELKSYRDMNGPGLVEAIKAKTSARLIEDLLKLDPQHVDELDQNGQTALHVAAERGEAALVGKLIQAGANCLLQDALDRTPRDLAKKEGHRVAAHFLKKAERNGESSNLASNTPAPVNPIDLNPVTDSLSIPSEPIKSLPDTNTVEAPTSAFLLLTTLLLATGLWKLFGYRKRTHQKPQKTTSQGTTSKIHSTTLSDTTGENKPSRIDLAPSRGSVSDSQSTSSTSSWQIAPDDLTWNSKKSALLGKGGFGAVYRGGYRHAKADVAIKVFHPFSAGLSAAKELKKEAAVMANLRSDYVVRFYGVCEWASTNQTLLVMECCSHGSLYDYLHPEEKNPDATPRELTWLTRYELARDISCGLDYLHRHNPVVLHRDLKSLNVLLTQDASGQLQAKLTDFGLSKMKNESPTQSSTPKSSVGTTPWMAPELLIEKDDKLADPSPETDVYALGMVLWELASKQAPFAGIREVQVISLLMKKQRPAIPQGTPQGYSTLIQRCWAERATERPSAKAVIAALDTLLPENQRSESAEAPLSHNSMLFSS